MKVKLFTTAQGNSIPSFVREVTVHTEVPPKYIYTWEIPKMLVTYGDEEPYGPAKHSEQRWKYNSKLSIDNLASCYLEIKE